MMRLLLMYILLGVGSLSIFAAVFCLSLYVTNRPRKKLFITFRLWNTWKKTIEQEEDSRWETLLRRAGRPFHWGKAEWLSAQWGCGFFGMLVVFIWALLQNDESFPFLTFCLVSCIGFLLPYFAVTFWAGYREEVLSNDIARFINRYVNLLENQVPIYSAMVKAARPTRQLKYYIPTLSEWNRDRDEALEAFKRKLGVDDAIILVSSIRTIEQLSTRQMSMTMQRLEWTVDNRRMFRHRKKIKSLGIGYSIIVYPAFYIGLIVAMFPWYKLLTEILDKYLV